MIDEFEVLAEKPLIPTDEQKYEMIEEAFRTLAAQGLIYDTGIRKWSERTRSYQVVWAAVPGKLPQLAHRKRVKR
jgi:hypothetical protein